MDEIKNYNFKSFFKDGLLETVILCQVLGVFTGFVLILYGNTEFDALPSSIIITNLIGFSIKSLGAVFYNFFYFRFQDFKYINLFLWLPSLFLGTIFGSLAGMIIGYLFFDTEFPEFLSDEFFFGLIGNLIIIIILFFLIYLYLTIKKNLEKKTLENKRIIELQTKAQLIALQSKVNPHFLFNTLNAMINLVYKAPEKVEKMILNLSDIYRKVLLYPETEHILLKEEVLLIREYLEIEKIRMGDRLDYKISVEPGLENCKIPPLIIEPIIENSVIHGISPKPEGGYIDIKINKDKGKLAIIVSDNGVGFEEQNPKSGFGLISIKERLLLIYNDSAAIKILNNFDKGVDVKLELPYEN